MKKIYLLLIGLVALNVLYGQQKHSINTGDRHVAMEVNSKNKGVLNVESSIESIDFYQVLTKGGEFTKMRIDGGVSSMSLGEPTLPQVRKMIEIPQGAECQVNVLSYDVKEYSLNELGLKTKIIPAQKSLFRNQDPAAVKFEMNEIVYSENEMFGFDLAAVEIEGQMRATRLATIVISPVQYNPVANTIKVYTNIKVEIEFVNADYAETQRIKEAKSSPYFKQFSDNNTKSAKALGGGHPIKYLIVSHKMFKETLQPFIRWKTQQGFNVVTAYTDVIGETATEIHDYIKGQYDAGTAENPAPTFALLVGDTTQLVSNKGRVFWFEPDPIAFPNGQYYWTDLYYFDYTDDAIPEMLYGRFSANNVEELQNQLDKTIEYEKYTLDDPSYIKNALLIAGKDNNPTDEVSLKNANGAVYYLKHYITAENRFNPIAFINPESNSKEEEIRAKFSEGAGLTYYTGHGLAEGFSVPRFRMEHVADVTNIGKPSVILATCCSTGSFYKDCFAESMMRAKDKGAVAYMGASQQTLWIEDCWWMYGEDEIIEEPQINTTKGNADYLFHENGEDKDKWCQTMGQIVNRGNLVVQGTSSENKGYYWEIYHVFGDPSLMPYLGTPEVMNITHGSVLAQGSSTFTVDAEEDAYVALSKDGILLAAAFAGSNGSVDLTFDTQNSGTLDIVVTKQNKQPYINSIAIGDPIAPVAKFSASPRSVEKGKEVSFSDMSNNGPTSWEWTFENGTPATSTDRNPKITYNTLGKYKVTLKVTNSEGSDTKIENEYIEVGDGIVTPSLTADFSSNTTSVKAGGEVIYTDKSTQATSWAWEFEGGTPSTSTSQNPTVVYNTNGSYNVKLTVSNGTDSKIMDKPAYITVSDIEGYCQSAGNSFSSEWIAKVTMGSNENESDAKGYSDFTNTTFNLTSGQNSILLTPAFSAEPNMASDYSNEISAKTSGDNESNIVTLTIVHDQYPSEVTWELKNESGELLASKDYYFTPANETVTEEFELPVACYKFTIKDASSDGICCDYGKGSYKLTNASNTILAEGGQFKAEEVKDFCIDNNGAKGNVTSLNNMLSSIKVYPNPVNQNQNLIVEFNNDVEYHTITLLDQVGKMHKVINVNSSKMSIPTNDLVQGVYFIQIKGNAEVTTLRVVIK